MKDQVKNVPALRFPEFKDPLLQTFIKEFAPLQRGFDLPVSDIVSGDYPVVFSNGILKTHNVYKAKSPGVVTGRSGTIGNLTYVEDNYWPHNTSLWVTNFFGNHPKYVYYFYDHFDLKRFSTGSGVPTLNRNDVHIQKIIVPSLPEQEKVASFLTAVDDKIQQLIKKKALLEQYKNGVMQQLFSQKLRFKDDQGNAFPDWEDKQLKDVLVETKKRNSENEFLEVFSVSKHKGVINQIDHLGRSYASSDISNYKVVAPGDIVYTKSPTSDFPFGIIKQNKLNRFGVVSVLYAVLAPANKYLGYIIDSYFQSSVNTYNYLNPLVQKGAKNTMNIGNNDFLTGAFLKLPTSVEEQSKIADFLSAIDDKISRVDTQLEYTQQFKKGLLQQMFV